MGEKKIWYGKRILVESADAREMKVGDTATFIHWGNMKILELQKDSEGRINLIKTKLDLENKVIYNF